MGSFETNKQELIPEKTPHCKINLNVNQYCQTEFAHDVGKSCQAPSTIEKSCQTFEPCPSLDKSSKKNLTGENYRYEMVQYRSVNNKRKLSKTIHHIANGSVFLAVKSLLNHQSEDIRKQTITGICNVIKKICSNCAKKEKTCFTEQIEDIDKLNFKSMSDELQRDNPLFWSILSSAGMNGRGVTNDIRVVTAASILFHTRNVFLNSLQRSVGISLYNNQLQKKGYFLLSKLGICNSYSTVNRDLHKLKVKTEKCMLELKKNVEDNIRSSINKNLCNDSSMDHSYSRPGTVSSTTVDTDHGYSKPNETKSQTNTSDLNPAYRFNLDNLDFHIKVRNMTEDHQNESKHYIQLMAIKDRVICEDLPNERPIGNLQHIPIGDFLPNCDDISSLRTDMIQVTASILTKHLTSFMPYQKCIPEGFYHQYSEQMKQKSTVVPLGILPLNENKTSEMIEILRYLQQYVPGTRSEEELAKEDIRDETNAGLRPIAVGGDQLSVERIRCAHMARLDGDTPEERLEGVFAMVEDFHEKMNFLQVIMDKFYLTTSCRDAGTLYQLRNLINRRNVVTKVSKDYHADGEFIDLTTEAHVIAAALKHLEMNDMSSKCPKLPKGLHLADAHTQKHYIFQLCGQIVDKHFLNDIESSIDNLESGEDTNELHQQDDYVYSYATNFCKLGMLRKISILATRYGDGIRILRHWKYATLLYHQAHKTKYRLEGFLLMAGVNALYTPRQRHEVIHNRFINLRGGEGHNLDGDYVMKLLNKYAKQRVKLLGPNHSAEVVERIGKTMMAINAIEENLHSQLKLAPVSAFHRTQKLDKDRKTLVKQLVDVNVFKKVPGREHSAIKQDKKDMFQSIDIKEFQTYIIQKKGEYALRKNAF
ncbi:uncharacterized protein [Mytilus edulis]|uniref:uncharacterized protein n=1 Tax=Mytilus edulis TaxID=6550 RepID=UPI0039F0AD2B